MTYSLNEIQTTSKKATRGAGYSWGLAEEAGFAVRWLCNQGMDGCAALARTLTQFDGADFMDISPNVQGEQWSAKGDVLCPLIAGAVLSDHANKLRAQAVNVGPVLEPSLLIPFAALCARALQGVVTVEFPGGVAILDGNNLSYSGHAGSATEIVVIRLGGELGTPNAAVSRGNPESSAWDALNKFAQRTYAPATEESRMKGAGAELPIVG